jgi:hypothetical protein
VIVLVESWPGPERGAVDLMTGLPRSAERPFVDLAVGRFRDQAWRRLARTCECALLHLRLGTIRPDGDGDGVVVDGAVVRSGVSNRVVRNAVEGGGDALVMLVRRLGEESRHRELKDAALVLWGWSAPGNFGSTFAAVHPERTIAFIRYHSHRRGSPTDANALRNTPALLIAGGKDDVAGTDDAEASEASVVSSHELILPWIAAVVRQRLEPDSAHLRPIAREAGSHGGDAGWLPDEDVARGWRTVVSAVK